jgi:hypothetical protein
MSKILITYAGRRSSTIELAFRMASELRASGQRVTVLPADRADDAWHYDAVIVGSELHGHRWDSAALDYLKHQAPDLAERPTFLFQNVEGADHPRTPGNIRRQAYEIGTGLPEPFGADVSPDVAQAAIAAWVHSIDTAVRSRVNGRTSEPWHHQDADALI